MRRIATIAEAHYVTFGPYNRMAAYDAYDIAKSAYEIHRDWNKIQTQFSGNDVYQTRPDVAITDEKGRLKDIYDFKMDNSETGFEDDWGGWSEGNVRQSGH